MAERTLPPLDDPAPRHRPLLYNPFPGDAFGRAAEGFARMMGTPAFLVGMTIFCAVWLTWNSVMPESAQFDPRALNFTLLTLILSLQASYAAPLLLLAQNRQDDRDRVQAEQDRQSNERNHATTDFITREIASLRLALNDVATRDFVRGELRDLLSELDDEGEQQAAGPSGRPSPQVDRAELREILREEIAAVAATMTGPSPAAAGTAHHRADAQAPTHPAEPSAEEESETT
ncbi:MAG TPA: DUF1003 domain-containing protein [Candidatus Brachybacterium merdavium]|uniref:DUF1003 domain-containing protein n=1 Tax=Candidatus Brachybacterium merdavium TaxID=2838513 RepID=A0A9D2RR14_9MICO|nr:DUF1003 domain-containing protein [Candidatus Brachybacterium merdavium]